MTKKEAAIVSAYTGFMLGEFTYLHKYVEFLLGRPVFKHEFANTGFVDKVKDLAYNDFVSITIKN